MIGSGIGLHSNQHVNDNDEKNVINKYKKNIVVIPKIMTENAENTFPLIFNKLKYHSKKTLMTTNKNSSPLKLVFLYHY